VSDLAAVAATTLVATAAVAWRRRAQRDPRRDVVAALVIVAVLAAALSGMGRPLTYRHGPVRVWSGSVDSDQNSQQVADPYTLTHLTHGVSFYAALRVVVPRWPLATRAVAAIAIECIWEVVENTDAVVDRYRAATIARGYYGDSVVNAVADVVAAALGFALTALLPVPATIALTLLLEGGLALWIRDGLFLNLLMLLWPLDVVRDWQRRG
jgi:hypothetical protein